MATCGVPGRALHRTRSLELRLHAAYRTALGEEHCLLWLPACAVEGGGASGTLGWSSGLHRLTEAQLRQR